MRRPLFPLKQGCGGLEGAPIAVAAFSAADKIVTLAAMQSRLPENQGILALRPDEQPGVIVRVALAF
ncbi:hypothetical protein CR492_15535 [Methylocella silvestris]|uniref:Uncharacterized protein n=1 Tax=Methylocella silvestris TaxID=199596 RepID=A0A2J7TE64_METSI|nr:hypothetical protein CR492_15535 [Methylocella silvestris]